MPQAKPSYSFQTEDARRLGVDAAILWQLIQELDTFTGNQGVVEAPESQWLAWLPFFSPARFMTAVETLCHGQRISREGRPDGDRLRLVLRSGTWTRSPSSAAADTAGPNTPETGTRPISQSARQTPAPTPGSSDHQDWGEYDMPPPMPALQPMLTEHTTVMNNRYPARPRYVDEPLYQMNRAESAHKAESAADTEHTGGQRENTLMTLDWQPSEDCRNMVQNKGIDIEFAMAQRESFVLYYRDSGQRQISWDTKFFNWVCRRWQYHLNDQSHDSQTTANHQTDARQRKQKLRAKLRDIGDLDW